MKLHSIASSKAVWLFPTNDLNPRGQHHANLLIALQERYQIQIMPTPVQIQELLNKKQGIPFGAASFKWSGGDAAIQATLFTDGIMAETRAGTDAADEFIADLLGWLKAGFGMTDSRKLAIKKVYGSEVFVHMAYALNVLNPKLNTFAEDVGAKASWSAPSFGFEVSSITISPNPAQKTQPQHPPFRLERDANAPFEADRYYSTGPLRTEDHLALLADFERAITPKASNARKRPS